MKTIKIKNKDYVMVNERIKYFRENYKDWAIETEIYNYNAESCVFKATIKNEKGETKATGFAQEVKNNPMSMVNSTSYVENCETSAVGRALAILGIGIDTSIASAEEVVNAIAKQAMPIVGGKYIFKGGKYVGKSIEEVGDDLLDYEYLEFCYNNEKCTQDLRDNIKMFLDEMNYWEMKKNKESK